MISFSSRLSIRLIHILVLVAPGTGRILYHCYPNSWTCTPDSCAQSNFITSGKIVLRSYQLATINLSARAPTATATACIPSSPTIGSTSSYETAPAICSSPSSTTGLSLPNQGADTKMIAVGAGVGVPLGIAVVALLFMFGRERRKNAQLRKKKFAVEAVNN